MRPSSHACVNLVKRDEGNVGKGGDVGGHVNIVDPPKLAKGCYYVIFRRPSGKVSQEHPLHDLGLEIVCHGTKTILSQTYPIIWICWFLHVVCSFWVFAKTYFFFLKNERKCQKLYNLRPNNQRWRDPKAQRQRDDVQHQLGDPMLMPTSTRRSNRWSMPMSMRPTSKSWPTLTGRSKFDVNETMAQCWRSNQQTTNEEQMLHNWDGLG